MIFATHVSAIGTSNGLTVADTPIAIIKIDLATAIGADLNDLARACLDRGFFDAFTGKMSIEDKRQTGSRHPEQRAEKANGNHARPKAGLPRLSLGSSLCHVTCRRPAYAWPCPRSANNSAGGKYCAGKLKAL